jgi:hypothetical protein
MPMTGTFAAGQTGANGIYAVIIRTRRSGVGDRRHGG